MSCSKFASVRIFRRTLYVIMSADHHIRHDNDGRWPSVESTVAYFAKHGIVVNPQEFTDEFSAEVVKKVDGLLAGAIARHHRSEPFTLEALIMAELAPMDVHIG